MKMTPLENVSPEKTGVGFSTGTHQLCPLVV